MEVKAPVIKGCKISQREREPVFMGTNTIGIIISKYSLSAKY
jgi:hypothetical protein